MGSQCSEMKHTHDTLYKKESPLETYSWHFSLQLQLGCCLSTFLPKLSQWLQTQSQFYRIILNRMPIIYIWHLLKLYRAKDNVSYSIWHIFYFTSFYKKLFYYNQRKLFPITTSKPFQNFLQKIFWIISYILSLNFINIFSLYLHNIVEKPVKNVN